MPKDSKAAYWKCKGQDEEGNTVSSSRRAGSQHWSCQPCASCACRALLGCGTLGSSARAASPASVPAEVTGTTHSPLGGSKMNLSATQCYCSITLFTQWWNQSLLWSMSQKQTWATISEREQTHWECMNKYINTPTLQYWYVFAFYMLGSSNRAQKWNL